MNCTKEEANKLSRQKYAYINTALAGVLKGV